MSKLIECLVCGMEFKPTKENHYVSRGNAKTGIVNIFGTDEPRLYDTFDCPCCGCQNTVQERIRNYTGDVCECNCDCCKWEEENNEEKKEDVTEGFLEELDFGPEEVW